MAKVDADLYEFLKNDCETGIAISEKEAEAYAHIDFRGLDKFVRIVGPETFNEGGLKVTMFENSICVELNEIFEADDNTIMDYKNCFDEVDMKIYEIYLKELIYGKWD